MKSHTHEHSSNSHDHGHHSPDQFRSKFWISLILTFPILLYSEHIQMWFGFQPPAFSGSEWIPFVLGTFIFVYGGRVFLQGGLKELRQRKPGMMVLIALAITVAYGYSVAVTFGFRGEELYWELATLVTIMLLGHWFEMSAISQARGSLDAMAQLLPDQALLWVDGEVESVAGDSLKEGDEIVLRPGARVPVDGDVVEGRSSVNQALITGESNPVPKEVGDSVVAGAINEEGSLRVRVTGTGDATALAGIMRLVAAAQSSSSRTQRLADQAAFWLVLISLSVALITVVAWSVAGASVPFIIERVVTVLVAACPHALGLAIPLVISIVTTLSARHGLLIKDRLALEEARRLDTIVFDKTGTLTRGEQRVVRTIAAPGYQADQVVQWADAVEAHSEHSLARGIEWAREERELERLAAVDFEALPGRGVRARVADVWTYVGGPHLLEELGQAETELDWIEDAKDRGGIYVLRDDAVVGVMVFEDVVREESLRAVRELQSRGVEVIMLTGDSEAVAQRVARELNIDRYYAGVLPEDKAEVIRSLQSEGLRVAMVGDGVNDAPALAQADVGIAIGAGTDVAVETAGIVLVKNDPVDVVRLMDLSRATYVKMVQNLAWATGYNVLILPLAAGILAPVGFLLPMAVAAVLMSASTIIVAINAQFLRRLDLS